MNNSPNGGTGYGKSKGTFPQVTVSYLKDEEAKKMTAKEKKEVEEFIKEQKEVSAGVDSGE